MALWHYRVCQWKQYYLWQNKLRTNRLRPLAPKQTDSVFAEGFDNFVKQLLRTAFSRLDTENKGEIPLGSFQVKFMMLLHLYN